MEVDSAVREQSERKGIVTPPLHARSELSPFAIECFREPLSVAFVRAIDAQAIHARGRHAQTREASRRDVDSRKIHETEIGAIAFVAANAFVVVDKIAAAVKHELVVI